MTGLARVRGFTMIELMIVIAIIAILAAVAVPQYLNYATRARIAEGLVLLSPVKAAVAEYYAINGTMPDATNWLTLLEQLGLPTSMSQGAASGAYVERIWWNNTANEIRIRYSAFPIEDKLLYLRADIKPGAFDGNACPPPAMRACPSNICPTAADAEHRRLRPRLQP